MISPLVKVGLAHRRWSEMGASPWLVRTLKFGLKLTWCSQLIRQQRNRYKLSPKRGTFVLNEVARWLHLGYCRRAMLVENKSLMSSRKIST